MYTQKQPLLLNNKQRWMLPRDFFRGLRGNITEIRSLFITNIQYI